MKIVCLDNTKHATINFNGSRQTFKIASIRQVAVRMLDAVLYLHILAQAIKLD